MSSFFNSNKGNSTSGNGTGSNGNQGGRTLKEWQLDVRPEVAKEKGKDSYKLTLRYVPNIFEDNKYHQGVLERKEFRYVNPLDNKDVAMFNDNPYLNQMEIPFLQMIENKYYALSDSSALKAQIKMFAKSSTKNACVAYVVEDKINPEQQGTFKIAPLDKETKKAYNARKAAGNDALDFLKGFDYKMKAKHKTNPDDPNKPFVVFDGSEFDDDSSTFKYTTLKGEPKEFTEKEFDWIKATDAKVKAGEVDATELLKSPFYALFDAKYPKDKISEFAPQKATDDVLDKFARLVAIIFTQYHAELEDLMAKATDMSYISNLKFQNGKLILTGTYAQKNALNIVNKNNDFIGRVYKFMNAQQPAQSNAQYAAAPSVVTPQQQAPAKPVMNVQPTQSTASAFEGYSNPMPEDDLPF